MSLRTLIRAQGALGRMKLKLINWLLGPLGRASRIIADADARLFGMLSRRLPVHSTQQAPFFNHLLVITSH
jgi:hypothetical protein